MTLALPRRALVAAAGLVLVAADAPVPAPVDGVTFDEWAAASARLAAGRPLAEVAAALQVTPQQWTAVNASFTQALKATPGPLITRYGQVFAAGNAGRLRAGAPKATTLASFAEYARASSLMSAASEAGQDPNKVLREEFGLTPFDYSQEGTRWIKAFGDAATGNPTQFRQFLAEREAAETEARARYGLTARAAE